MRSTAKVLNLSNNREIRVRVVAAGIGVLFLVLAFAAVTAVATEPSLVVETDEPDPIRVVESEKTEDTERVTLAIPVEDGAEIDLETSKNVRIDSWEGDEVLVIVERVVKPGMQKANPNSKPMDIQIKRSGKGVSIRAFNEYGVDGVDVFFRVVVPKSLTASQSTIKTSYDLSKLTHVVLSALHKEAVRWVIR